MPPAKPVSAPLAPHHAVAGHQDRRRVPPRRRPDRARGRRPPYRLGDLAVAARLPEGDTLDLPPHEPLEIGPLHVEGEVEVPPFPAEVLVDLPDRPLQLLDRSRPGAPSPSAPSHPQRTARTPRRLATTVRSPIGVAIVLTANEFALSDATPRCSRAHYPTR